MVVVFVGSVFIVVVVVGVFAMVVVVVGSVFIVVVVGVFPMVVVVVLVGSVTIVVVVPPPGFKIVKELGWSSQHINIRLAVQDGLFTVSPDPTVPFSTDLCSRTIIAAKAKNSLLDLLQKFGIHCGSIFPGLEGVAKYVESQFFHFRGVRDLKTVKAAILEWQAKG